MMNRLLTAKTTATSGAPCWGQSYVYDRYANLSAINVPSGYSGCDNGPALSLSINSTNNKITNANFTYDAAGNLTASPVGYSYTWNAEGRMKTAVAGGVTYTYTYNGDGQRVKKAAASASSYDKLYWYGLGGEVLAESALDGTLTSEYIFMGATRIARRDVSSGSVYYFLGDRLGNARIVTNATGGVVEESDMLPYGTERTITDSLDNNYKFTGHERDGESGLDHTLERQHSGTLGRWLSADPVRGKQSNPQSWNRYAYVKNSPCNAIDPSGGSEHWVDPYPSPLIILQGPPYGRPDYDNGIAVIGPDDPLQSTPIDAVTSSIARSLLQERLKNFKGSNCDKAFSSMAKANKLQYSTTGFKNESLGVEFYNARSSQFGSLTQDQVVENGDQTTLNETLAFGNEAAVIRGPSKNAVLIGDNFWGLERASQRNVLMHEMVHTYFGLDDAQVFEAFSSYGLSRDNPGTSDISDWLSRDCKQK